MWWEIKRNVLCVCCRPKQMILVLLLFRYASESCTLMNWMFIYLDFPQISSYVKIKVRRQIVAPVLASNSYFFPFCLIDTSLYGWPVKRWWRCVNCKVFQVPANCCQSDQKFNSFIFLTLTRTINNEGEITNFTVFQSY